MMSPEDIQQLLAMLAEETIVEPTSEFPFRVSRCQSGYSSDPQRARLQATLSLMLEAARWRERGA